MIRRFTTSSTRGKSARAWLDGEAGRVAPARPAATVVLVRNGVAGVEVFLLRRQATMAFAAGMHVFPGGGVDSRDDDEQVPWAGPSPQRWAAWLGATPVQARELVCAAVRETFEECGVLLAGPGDGGVVEDVSGDDWEADRQGLLSREVAMSDLLVRRRLVLRTDLLRPWAHWITPEFEPRRYDTRFFLAVAPQGQKARHVDGGEASESGWSRAADVLAAHAARRVRLLPPTLVTIEEVAAAPDVAALLAAERTVRPVLPYLTSGAVPGSAVLVADLPD